MIWTQSKELAKTAQLTKSIDSLEESIAFYKAIEGHFRDLLARVTAESTRVLELLGSTNAQVVDLGERLAGKDAVAKSTVSARRLGGSLEVWLRNSTRALKSL